jgi:DNA (cytosine-5)-methyltransferase 1
VKPPYAVPGMAEVRAVPGNGFTVASTFSGCGGSSCGYRMAGFRVGWASEFIPAAAATYAANWPDTILDTRDIREVQPREILSALGLAEGELDLLDGSPPCASFSTAGTRSAGWGVPKAYSDTVQRVDDLFFEFARLLAGVAPRMFVAENVSGLVKGVAKGYFIEIFTALREAGYRVEAQMLDASWLGVPQHRKRMIFMGVREDLSAGPVFPVPLPYQYTVRDALPWILAQGGGGFYNTDMLPVDRPSDTLGASPNTGNGWCPPSRVVGEIGEVAVVHQRGLSPAWAGGGNVSDEPLPAVTVGIGSLNSQHYQVRRIVQDTRRPNEPARDVTDQPAPTQTAGSARAGHGIDTVAEATGPGPFYDPETGEDISLGRFSIGRRWQRLTAGQRAGGYGPPVHPSPEEPYPTVVNSGGTGGGESPGAGSRRLVTSRGGAHWADCRKLTLGELRALSGFPPDFVLTGSYAQRWERIGRAVPPVMMSHIAAAARDGVLVPLRERGVI